MLGIYYREVANLNWFLKNFAKAFFGGLPDGSNEDSEEALLKAIELVPTDIITYYELARTYEKMKKKDKERFLNIKARLYYRLKEYLQKGNAYNLDDKKLEEELLLMKKEHQSNGKLKIIDPSKSPDYADSVVIALAKRKAPGIHTGRARTWM